MPDIFISYTRDDRARCEAIAQRLQAMGLDVWFDVKLAAGSSFDADIEENIRAAKAVMVLWSPKSTQSKWVRNEATIGQNRDVLVSVEIAKCELPVAFVNTHTEQLHQSDLRADNPAWTNILTRLAGLTGHPGLAAYKGATLKAVRRRKGAGSAIVIGAVLALIAGGGAAAWAVYGKNLMPAEQEAKQAPEATPAPVPAAAAEPGLPKDVADFAATLNGQWAMKREECPAHKLGQPVDMTPSAGPWVTVQSRGKLLVTTTMSKATEEQVVGLQNAWLQTLAEGQYLFYRLDESGRLMVRVGDQESFKLEPCI